MTEPDGALVTEMVAGLGLDPAGSFILTRSPAFELKNNSKLDKFSWKKKEKYDLWQTQAEGFFAKYAILFTTNPPSVEETMSNLGVSHGEAVMLVQKVMRERDMLDSAFWNDFISYVDLESFPKSKQSRILSLKKYKKGSELWFLLEEMTDKSEGAEQDAIRDTVARDIKENPSVDEVVKYSETWWDAWQNDTRSDLTRPAKGVQELLRMLAKKIHGKMGNFISAQLSAVKMSPELINTADFGGGVDLQITDVIAPFDPAGRVMGGLYAIGDSNHQPPGEDIPSSRSMGGRAIMFACGPVAVTSKKFHTLTRSSTDGEVLVASDADMDLVYYRGIAQFLGVPQTRPSPIFTDNDATIFVAADEMSAKRLPYVIKHLRILQQSDEAGRSKMYKVMGHLNPADPLTKFIEKEPGARLRHMLYLMGHHADALALWQAQSAGKKAVA
jgi:hypothetical protein